MERQDLIDYLLLRQKFTRREWADINHLIDLRFKEKADKLVLDDFDLDEIVRRVTRQQSESDKD